MKVLITALALLTLANPALADDDTTVLAATLIPIAVILVILFAINAASVIVKQSEAVVVERCGRFKCVLKSGWNWLVPFVDRPREFVWQYTKIGLSGVVTDETRTSYRIDLREAVYHFLPMEVYTKDTILLDVSALMYYRIVDVRKAIYEVDDLQSALSNTAQTQLKEVFGSMSFHEALQCQQQINDHLVKEFGKLFEGWGIEVLRMELLDLTPNRNERGTTQAMKKQMMAERERRGEFIKSEGQKAALNLRAEGTKKVAQTMGVAEQEALRKRSEGKATATIELANAEKSALETLGAAVRSDGISQTEYFISKRYLELFGSMVASVERRTVYVPYDARNISGLLGTSVPRTYGAKPGQQLTKRNVPAKRAEFSELD
jgi:regulator of protease activity HflC (stomatin/prohibitin superfamily)